MLVVVIVFARPCCDAWFERRQRREAVAKGERRKRLEQVGRPEVRILPSEKVERTPYGLKLAEKLIRLEATSTTATAALLSKLAATGFRRVRRTSGLLKLSRRLLRGVEFDLDELKVIFKCTLLSFGSSEFILELLNRFSLVRQRDERMSERKNNGQDASVGSTCCFAASTRRSSS